MEQLFFELLQVAVGNRERLTHCPSKNEWVLLYEIAQRQVLVGICFAALETLPSDQRPPMNLLMDWLGQTEYLKARNEQTTVVCWKICRQLEQDGFKPCILKGQTNHCYYPEHLAELRSCGDVDIWVMPSEGTKNPVMAVMEYLEQKGEVESLCYLHAEVCPVNEVPVEVHFRPSFMNCPWSNRRFLKLFDFATCTTNGSIGRDIILPKLKTQYDVVFQLNHLYRHLLDEGVGLRQVTDFYFLLASDNSITIDKSFIRNAIDSCGMKRFTSALMWVLRDVFMMREGWLICEPSEKDGQFLLNEIMIAGNFGHHDPRMQMLEVKKGKTSYQIKRACRRMKRNIRFLTSYPMEVIFEPYARLMHFWWRKYRLWRL